ncbi:hypothetical protein BDV32DRAFT_122243 [Aspergillus pseudonomiae]|uniref:Uncharacterized protein n=1 Tax=Aspergillus pseudonomiae TaxID=1506151 RepID=A0A5N6I533_9EURO|nr:uncharacterized protein BDV37DRAFT_254820 [Aspergillus pseudonomiae]KAB8260840.1 hypothetical protein BDV32DRAFT_122243 [Aspergillus pseudonomiae]KAE8401486.1 hypothetical protein BDV37DRAFT_254820 [Aspergillus pseudonomiae]
MSDPIENLSSNVSLLRTEGWTMNTALAPYCGREMPRIKAITMSHISDSLICSFNCFSSYAADASVGLIQATTVAVSRASSDNFPRCGSCEPRLCGTPNSGIVFFPNLSKAVEGYIAFVNPSPCRPHLIMHGAEQ